MKRIFIGATAALLLLSACSATSTEGTDNSQLQNDYSNALEQQEQLRDELNQAQQKIKELESTQNADTEAVENLKLEIEEQAEALDQREKELDKREKQLNKKEEEHEKIEKAEASNTVSGDGMYQVGKDMKAGTWKTSGGGSCYYAILRSDDLTDIIHNHFGAGPAIAKVSDGQVFETSGCDDWKKQ